MAESMAGSRKDAGEAEVTKEKTQQKEEKAKTPPEDRGAVQQPDKKKKQETVYPAGEFARNAEMLFGVPPECVEAAFREKGISKCSKGKAKETVEKFMKRKVE